VLDRGDERDAAAGVMGDEGRALDAELVEGSR
jgi:hypothetical protein